MTEPGAARSDGGTLPEPATSRAVLVGVHEGCTTIGDWAHDLPAVGNNINTLKRIFSDGTVWSLPPGHCVEILQPATPRDVLDRLEEAAAEATDTLVVYLAGHGILDDAGRLHLVLPGARYDYHCLPYDHVRACLARHRRARQTVVVIDCCFSGRALDGAMGGQDRADLPGLIRDTTLIEGAAILTACSAHLTAVAPEGAEFTVFTGELISVLTDGVPDGPPLLTLHAVHEDLVRRLARRPGLPIPQLGTRGQGGRIPMARNRAFQGTAPKPGVHRSVYLRQVEQIAPPRLIGRGPELAELAAFCEAPDTDDGPGYLWWRAPAWSGKSALLAWFTLHPSEKTHVVAFFITARFAGQSDLNAFLNATIEQLTALVDHPEPVSRLDRLPWFYELLDEAGRRCRERGERLVLLVDGLDEDRGIREGPYSTSIAAALPSRLPPGTRAVLSGRPHPPLPDDVPAHHPLREANIIRPLAPWGEAQSVRELASFELRGLLNNAGMGYEVLAFLVAAGGGLSVHDLAELTGQTPWRIEDLVLGPAGRTFVRRPGRPDPDDAARAALLLAHEELTVTAEARIGARELASYAGRIHDWADGYRDRGWPVGTPEFLLTGYLSLLRRAGLADRMAAYVCDPDRADRLFALTGGDLAALEDIAAVQRFVRDRDEPDLGRLLALAIVRDRLDLRSSRIPSRLPVVWAGLGQTDRAEALARAVNTLFSPAASLIELVKAAAESGADARAWDLAAVAGAVIRENEAELGAVHALLGLIRAVAPTGDADRLAPLVDWAQEAAATANDLNRANLQGEFADVAALCGQVERAIRVADTLVDPRGQSTSQYRGRALANVVRTLARSGRLDGAHRALSLITDPVDEARALTALLPSAADPVAAAGAVRQLTAGMAVADRATVRARLAEALADAGHPDEAAQILDAMDRAGEPGRVYAGVENAMVKAFCRLARAETERHDPGRALAFLNQAEQAVAFINLSPDRADAVKTLAAELVRIGMPERAERLVAAIPNEHRDQNHAFAELAGDIARAGDTDRAERIVSGIEDPYAGAWGLTYIAEALVEQGDRRRAERLASRAEALAHTWAAPAHLVLSKLVDAVGRAGDVPRARRIAARAEQVVRTEVGPVLEDLALADVARSLARLGDVPEATRIAQSIEGSFGRELALAEVVKALARAGDTAAATRLAETVHDKGSSHKAMTGLAVEAARRGEVRLAAELAAAAEKKLWKAFAPGAEPAKLAKGIVQSMEAVAWIGDGPWLRNLAEPARQIIPHVGREKVANAWVAEALTRAGALDEAEAVADDLVDAASRARARARIARALARTGDVAGAERMAAGITARRFQAEAIALIAEYAVPSRRLLADALCREPYAELLTPVALVDPDAVLRAADLIEGAE